MSADNFWDDRENAQKFVEEASALRKRIDPYRKAENQLADLQGMVELGVEKMKQSDLAIELSVDTDRFVDSLDELELAALLSGPQDRAIAFFPLMQEQVELKAVIGRICLCGCISAGGNAEDGRL